MRRINPKIAIRCSGVCLAMLITTGAARAQTGAESKAAAEALFDEGRRLIEQGQFAAACEKLAQSDRLDPAVGTQLNLAVCYEKAGKTASAWATYRRAAASARERGQAEREKLAREAADALEPKLTRLTIAVPAEARVEGLVITKNGERVAPDVWGQALPVDPGEVRVEATAPGRQTWRTSVAIQEASKTETLTIPALSAAPDAPAETAAEPSAAAPASPPAAQPASAPASATADLSETGSSQRTWGLVIGGAGIVGVVAGGFFALQAQSKNDDSKAFCSQQDPNTCTAEGVELRNDARANGNIATAAMGIGLALVATGTVLYLTAPSEPKGARVGVAASATGAGISLRGAW
jgi:serine/threonine-protein kinase